MDKSWSEALALMRKALAILDEFDGPSEVGADLDLAIARLEGRFGERGQDGFDRLDVDGPLSQQVPKDERELRR